MCPRRRRAAVERERGPPYLFLGILCDEEEVSQFGQWREAEILRALTAHQQHRRGAVRQEARVRRSDRTVRLDERGFQLERWEARNEETQRARRAVSVLAPEQRDGKATHTATQHHRGSTQANTETTQKKGDVGRGRKEFDRVGGGTPTEESFSMVLSPRTPLSVVTDLG
jgi:hypothetical protein